MYRTKPVTKKSIANKFSPCTVEQLGSKQLFIVDKGSYCLLVSYYTAIGYRLAGDNCWTLTAQKYSATTSKQTTWFSRNYNSQVADSEWFDRRVAEL